MTVPGFQSLMLPLLELAGDANEHSLGEAIETLALHFGLSDDERNELLPSGKQSKFDNRVSWARTYLKKAGLLAYTGRGKFRITDLGVEVLQQNPSEINIDR